MSLSLDALSTPFSLSVLTATKGHASKLRSAPHHAMSVIWSSRPPMPG